MKNTPFVIGLTGSIGMGKSTTAQMFADEGIPVWDADAAVERLYAKGGAAVPVFERSYPETVKAGLVSKTELKNMIAKDPSLLSRIESIVHPLVAMDRAKFIASAQNDIVLVDVPLLFETGADETVDYIITVSAGPKIQRERVLARKGMTEAHFEMLLEKQMPDHQKRLKAHKVITTETLESAKNQVQLVLRELRERLANA